MASWGSWFADVKNKAQQIGSDLVETANKAAETVTAKAGELIDQNKNDFQRAQQKNELEKQRKDAMSRKQTQGLGPWHVFEEKRSVLSAELRKRIEELSKDPTTFTVQAPDDSVFQFDLEYSIGYCQAALKQDQTLENMRRKLVPGRVKELQFWRNYFYRVQLLRDTLEVERLQLTPEPLNLGNARASTTSEAHPATPPASDGNATAPGSQAASDGATKPPEADSDDGEPFASSMPSIENVSEEQKAQFAAELAQVQDNAKKSTSPADDIDVDEELLLGEADGDDDDLKESAVDDLLAELDIEDDEESPKAGSPNADLP